VAAKMKKLENKVQAFGMMAECHGTMR